VNWENAKLHLGCGSKYLAGWINADGVAVPVVEGVAGHPDIVLDIHKECSLLPSNALAWIYTSHVIEHLYTDLLPGILTDLCRALRPGGRLTIATTDLDGIYLHRYKSPDNGDAWAAAMFGECRSTDHPMAAHRDCFTYVKLGKLLADAGFSAVRPWEPGQYPEILALRDYSVTARLVSLLIEGVK